MSGPCVIGRLDSPVGPIVAGAHDAGICLLEFAVEERLQTQMRTLRDTFDCAVTDGNHPYLDQLEAELRDYFSGVLKQFTVPLVAPGTPFQERVWSELRRIPYGETRSYEEIAVAVSSQAAQRAVGRANGANRIAIVIPCHRVINKSGRLGGYGGLLWRKEALLGLERTGRLIAQPSLLC
jgi:AraC family transcriptional regulator of adaptative response/methylated-DNA-[protein]-cysteine methyltransferase